MVFGQVRWYMSKRFPWLRLIRPMEHLHPYDVIHSEWYGTQIWCPRCQKDVDIKLKWHVFVNMMVHLEAMSSGIGGVKLWTDYRYPTL